MQQLFRVVPFIKRRGRVQAFVALQADEFCAERTREGFGNFSFSDTGGAFDQQRFAERNRQIEGGRNRGISDVNLLFQQALNPSDFVSQIDLALS